MTRSLLPSVDALLDPSTLAQLSGGPIRAVHHEPFKSVDSLSGGSFLRVWTDGPPERYVLKRISMQGDWIMRATGDDRCRAVRCWQDGLLDELPRSIEPAYVACARDGDGWAILARDYSEALIPPGDDPISAADNELFLRTMAELHATFWGRAHLTDPAVGYFDLTGRYCETSPEVGRRESGGTDAIPKMIVQGWELFRDQVDTETATLIYGLLDDPAPLVRAALRYPQTVIHGDWKLGNLGVIRGDPDRTLLLDWAVIGPAGPGADLAWYLAVNCARLPISKEATIAYYADQLRQRLGDRFDDAWWLPSLELSLLGGFVQLGWPKALGAVHGATEATRARERAELAWWSAHALRAQQYL